MIPPEAAAMSAAALSDGVLTWPALRALGVTEAVARQRVRTGQWQRPHVGVYVLPHDGGSTLRTTARAALIAAPAGAVASHSLAAQLDRLQGLPEAELPEVSVRTELGRRSKNSLVVHRTGRLEISSAHGFPVTTVARTLSDLAPRRTRNQLVFAADSALKAELVRLQVLEETAQRRVGRPGAGTFCAAMSLARYGSDSPMESWIRLIVHDDGLPEPELQITVKVGGASYRIDLGWRRWKVGIEADGRAFHGSAAAVLEDRRRQNALLTEGWLILRFTWDDLVHRPWQVLAAVREALRVRGAA